MNNHNCNVVNMKRLSVQYLVILCLSLFMVSCHEGNYYDAIPRGSIALVQVSPDADSKQFSAIGLFLGTKDLAGAGIDTDSPVYLFESPDGNLGVCAKVSSSSDLEDFVGAMNKKGEATAVKERKGCKFSLIRKSFLLAFNDEAMVAVGPVLASSESELVGRLSRYLELDPERGAGSDEMFATLSESKDNITLVAKAIAMPKQFVAPFLLGTPAGTSASDVTVTASVEVGDSVLTLNGATSSPNLNIQQAMDRSRAIFGKLSAEDFADSESSPMVIYVNAKGEDIVNLMKTNKDLSQILATGSFRNKLSASNGPMAITLKNSKGTTGDAAYSADVVVLTGAQSVEGKTLRVVLNVKTVGPEVLQMLSPFLSGISKIVYQQ